VDNRFTQFDDKIRNLIELAQDSSKESRTLLFHHICDLFLQGRVPNAKSQRRMLREIMYELLSRVDLTVRREIAAQICDISNPPSDLVQVLSEDEIAVAGPLLDRAIIPDEQLIYIIRHGSEAHRLRISRRFGLSPMVRAELERMESKTQATGVESEDDSPAMAPELLDEQTTADILSIIRQQVTQEQNDLMRPDTSTHDVEHKVPQGGPSHPEGQSPKGTPPPASTHQFHRPLARSIQELTQSDPTGNTASTKKDQQKTGVTASEYAPQTHTASRQTPPEDTPPSLHPSNENRRPQQTTNTQKPTAPETPSHDHKPKVTLVGEDPGLQKDINARLHDIQSTSQQQADYGRASADWYWEVNRAGTVSFISDQAFVPFGRPPQALVGEYFADLCQIAATELSEHNPHDGFDELFEKRSSFRDIPFTVISADGLASSWLLSGVAVFDTHSGRFRGFRGSARQDQMKLSDDITDDTNTPPAPEDAAARQMTMPANGTDGTTHPLHIPEAAETGHTDHSPQVAAHQAVEMMQQLSHEFRTPLNAIIGFSEMIDTEAWGPINDRYHKQTHNILSAAHNLKNVVNDILDAAKLDAQIEELHPESFSLKALLKDCLQTIEAEARDRRVSIESGDNNIDVIVHNDPKAIAFCITKMLIASIEGAQAGDSMSLSILVNSDGHIRIETPLLGEKITDSEQENLFIEPDFLDKKDNNRPAPDIFSKKIGPGFGLAIARKMAERLGGTLNVVSQDGLVTHLALQISNLPKNP
tara:strand:+ start:1927 stop:4206 length:2280 start_codon:yes stop_codon:yes gene_type:complete